MFTSVTISRRRFMELAAATGVAASTLRIAPTTAQEDANFIYADISEPAALLPIVGISSFGTAIRSIYEPLLDTRMTLNGDGSVNIDLFPQLAESWELLENNTWRFTLRQGVTFTNGEAFNADAVKASWDVLSDPEVLSQYNGYNMLAFFSGCEVVDEFTVDITAYQPGVEAISMYLPMALAIMPPKMLEAGGIDAFVETPTGSGPYAFRSWSRGQEIVLERNEDYWDANYPATYTTLTYIFRPEAAVRAQTIASGEADFAYNIGAEQAFTLDNPVIGGGFQSTSIRLNVTAGPTTDVNLRKAINMAIDRQAICDAIFKGTATPISFFAFQPVQVEPYAYDPEQATQLINDGWYAGTELEFVYGEGRVPEEDQLAELYKAYFEAIGLVINLRKVEPGQYNDIGEQEYAEQPPLYMETTSAGNYGEIGGLGGSYFADPAWGERFAGLALLTDDARIAEMQSIAEDLHENAARAWVAGVQQAHGVSNRVNHTMPLNSRFLVKDLMG